MAKFKITPDAVRYGLPFAINGLKWMASRTDNTVDDKVIGEVEKALANPLVLAFVISLIAGEDEVVPVQGFTPAEEAAIDAVRANSALIGSLCAVAA